MELRKVGTRLLVLGQSPDPFCGATPKSLPENFYPLTSQAGTCIASFFAGKFMMAGLKRQQFGTYVFLLRHPIGHLVLLVRALGCNRQASET